MEELSLLINKLRKMREVRFIRLIRRFDLLRHILSKEEESLIVFSITFTVVIPSISDYLSNYSRLTTTDNKFRKEKDYIYNKILDLMDKEIEEEFFSPLKEMDKTLYEISTNLLAGDE